MMGKGIVTEALSGAHGEVAKQLAEALIDTQREVSPAWMPIQGTPLAVRIGNLSEDQARQNHGQDLHTLARRGGLSPFEAVALAKRLPLSYVRSLHGVSETERVRTLMVALSEHKV